MFQCELLCIDYIIEWSYLFSHIFHLQYYWRVVTKNCETDLFLTLKLCHWFMYKDMIAMPYIAQQFCITYFVRIFSTLKHDVWVSSYTHADPSWPHILRPIHLQQSDHRFRYPVFFHHLLQCQPWLCIGVLGKMMTFCAHCMRIHILISDDRKAEILDSGSDIPTTAPHKHFLSILSFC